MMAKMIMAKSTNNAIWRSGAMALKMDFNTTWRPERGRRQYDPTELVHHDISSWLCNKYVGSLVVWLVRIKMYQATIMYIFYIRSPSE